MVLAVSPLGIAFSSKVTVVSSIERAITSPRAVRFFVRAYDSFERNCDHSARNCAHFEKKRDHFERKRDRFARNGRFPLRNRDPFDWSDDLFSTERDDERGNRDSLARNRGDVRTDGDCAAGGSA